MEKRYQVFVSSTYRDLQAERQEIIQALLELDCLPAGMELFPAASEDQWTLIKNVIDLSDYYVVVLGGKYGSITDAGISYTEREFDYAVSKNMQILGFVPEDASKLAVEKVELNPEVREKLQRFQDKVMQRMIKKYRGPDDLGGVVSRALNIAMRNYPQEGWVRGSYAMTPQMEAEIAQLREKIAEDEVQRLKSGQFGEDTDTAGFKQGEDAVRLAFFAYQGEETIPIAALVTWDEIFQQVGPIMMDEATADEVEDRLVNYLRSMADWEDKQEKKIEIESKLTNPIYGIYLNQWERVIVQLRAIGLIDRGTKRRPVSDKNKYWRLTEKGDFHLARLLAERRNGEGSSNETKGTN
jgi:hypothetical protein